MPRALALVLALLASPVLAGEEKKEERAEPGFPKLEEVVEGYEKVVSTADGRPGLYTLYTKEKEASVLAELPGSFESQRLFIHNVVSSGSELAGVGILMSGDTYARWTRIGDRLALVEPERLKRTTGDIEAQRSHDQMYTDRVLLSVPILTMGARGGPVIDLSALLLHRSHEFFGPMTKGADVSLATLEKAKAFPRNLEIAFEVPLGRSPAGASDPFGLALEGRDDSGRLTGLHYSISVLPEKTGYTPRAADPRVGYFTTFYNDMAKTITEDDPWTRYVTRWHVEKADPSLGTSPPKQPIVWYVEHTTPIKYRRHIRDALLSWNRAFEAIGIVDAIEVRQQDARTGAYMDLDPEDARYNFVRWNNNQAAFAIGPSRADPLTGQIFDADLTLNAGIFASIERQLRSLLPGLAIEGFTAETMAWLDEHGAWDPRVRLLPPAEQERVLARRAAARAAGEARAHPPVASLATELFAGVPAVGRGRRPVDRDMCLAGLYMALSNGLTRLVSDAAAAEAERENDEGRPDATAGGEGEADDRLDGLPEDYVVAMLRWVTAHEAGHCLGLAHNFMASTIYDLEEINSADFPADRAIGGSVMEYAAPNINYENLLGEVQGQWNIQHVGPYDMWAIDYGYGFHDEKGLQEVLSRASEPQHVFGSNPDAVGADPRVRTYDFGSDPLRFAEARMTMARELRTRIVEDFVEEGEGWGEARDAYEALLGQHLLAVSIASGWVGGAYVHKDFKGDAERTPIEDVPAETQRRALDFVIDNTFHDEAFGLTSELLYRMSVDRWNDLGDRDQWDVDPAFTSHDLVAGVQASALTMILNPTTLRRVYDNELRVPADEDALTVPELLETVVDAAFTELGSGRRRSSVREPAISSLRRNLQTEVVDRLVGLGVEKALSGAVAQPVGALCRMHLEQLHERIGAYVKSGTALDAYTRSHLLDTSKRIARALEAQYVVDRG